MNEEYDMVMVDASGCDRGPEYWIFYPKGGNYIYDEEFRLPAGSKVLNDKAATLLEKLNG